MDKSQIHDQIDSMNDEVIHQNNYAGPLYYNSGTVETAETDVIPFAHNLKEEPETSCSIYSIDTTFVNINLNLYSNKIH